MVSSCRTLAAALVLAAVAGCAGPDLRTVPEGALEDDRPLADLDELLAGAPANDDIPLEDGGPVALLPPKLDLTAHDSPVRDQMYRGVCSIFSTVALMESLYKKKGALPDPDFSEQYLQWLVKTKLGVFPGSSGSANLYNLQAVTQYGVVTEALDPYEPEQWNGQNDPACAVAPGASDDGLPVQCYTNGAPSAEAQAATAYKLPPARWLNTAGIKDHLALNGTPVAIGVTFFLQAWNHGASTLPIEREFHRFGFVTYPNDVDKELSLAQRSGHAVLIVGYDDELEVPMRGPDGKVLLDATGAVMREKGFFLFKNSWGTDSFGSKNPVRAGYGYISYRYVAEFGSAMVADVPVTP